MTTLLQEYVTFLLESSIETWAKQAATNVFNIVKSHKGRARRYEITIKDWKINILIKKSRLSPTDVKINAITFQSGTNVKIEIGQGFVPQILQATYHRLIRVMRHELEHYMQFQTSAKTPEPTYDVETALSGNPDEMRRFLLDPHEIKAFVSDIYMNAKKTRRPFSDAFNDRIKTFGNLMFKAGANSIDVKNVIRDVKSAWFAYAKQRYPAVQF